MNAPLSHRAALAALLLTTPALAQDDVGARLDQLERENAELRRRIDAVAEEVERVELRDVIPPVGESRFGMGPAASKVYAHPGGLSIGGYGEGVYTSYAGDTASRADLLRWVLYAGYKFDEHWVFNSEVEVEHATTEEDGEVSLEFAYLEYLHDEALAVRAGLLLTPMGFVNEMHEPTTYYGAARPEVERRLLPSTWRENGAGVHGALGDFDYSLYALAGLDASGFGASGLRGGRQRGSESLAEDVALCGRLDWRGAPGVVAGVSAWYGDSGQGGAAGDVGTTILDAHVEVQRGGWRLRGLYAQADLDDTVALSALNGSVVGERMVGWYAEAGFDLMTLRDGESRHQVIPFVRYEDLDTHASVASGLVADPTQDENVVTFGVNWLPLPEVVFKLDYQDFDQGTDRLHLGMGYVF